MSKMYVDMNELETFPQWRKSNIIVPYDLPDSLCHIFADLKMRIAV